MREAMLARDVRRTGTLRMAMAAFQNRRIELGRDLTDEDVVDLLSKQMKQRRESIEHFKAAGRDAMVQVEEEESAIIAEFLPAAALRGRAARRWSAPPSSRPAPRRPPTWAR